MKKLILIFCVLVATEPFAQTTVDTTSVEMTIAKAFISALNKRDSEEMRDFTLTYRTEKALSRTPIEERLKSYRELHEKMGIIEIESIDKLEKGNIKLVVYATGNDTWFKMGFKLGENDKLESLSMLPTKNPNKADKDLDLKGQLGKIVTDGLAPGAAMVVIKNGKIDKSIAVGVRNSETNESIRISDPLHLGSVSKSFTASLVGKLIDQGKIQMSTRLEEIFAFEMNEKYKSVTIRNVLAHEGGFPGFLTDQGEEEELRLQSLPGTPREQRLAFAKEILNKEPAFEPNNGMNYSNAGYSVLAAICEHVANKSWEEQLNDVIFKPLKMKSAGIGWPTDVDPSFPEGHEENGQPQNTKEYFLGSYLEPAGDIHCSMKDLAKFAIAHMDGLNGTDGFISSKTVKLLHEFSDENTYAGGWMSEEVNGTTIYFHAGTAGTFFSYIAINPANNSAYVIAANSGNIALFGIFREIIEL